MNLDGWRWRIATTEAGLQYGAFALLNVPIPTQAPYYDHSSVVPQSDGRQASHGYTNITLLWDELTQSEMNALRSIVHDVRIKLGVIYLTIERQDGTTPASSFIDISGNPGVLRWTGASPYNRTMQKSGKNIELFVNHVTIINDPSIYSS